MYSKVCNWEIQFRYSSSQQLKVIIIHSWFVRTIILINRQQHRFYNWHIFLKPFNHWLCDIGLLKVEKILRFYSKAIRPNVSCFAIKIILRFNTFLQHLKKKLSLNFIQRLWQFSCPTPRAYTEGGARGTVPLLDL